MAARGGKALVLSMLISFLLVQGTLGTAYDFAACYCHHYKSCMLTRPRSKELFCMKRGLQDCTLSRCSNRTPFVMPLADAVDTVTDEGSMTVPAGGVNHGDFNVAEGSIAAAAGGADHGEFIVAEEDAGWLET